MRRGRRVSRATGTTICSSSRAPDSPTGRANAGTLSFAEFGRPRPIAAILVCRIRPCNRRARGCFMQANLPRAGAVDREVLTRREIEVVRLVAEGLSGREAAQRLCRSPRTVENHLRAVYQKLGVRNRVELLHAAEHRGLLASAPSEVRAQPGSELEFKSRMLDIIRSLDARMALAANDSYFGELVIALSGALHARWAGISEHSAHDEMIEIIVMAADGVIGEQSSCQAEGSPCGETLRRGSFVVADDIAQVFPGWALAAALGIRSYAGVRLDDRLLGTVGTLWIMDDKPLERGADVEMILRLFGRRTAAELALAQTLDQEISRA
ncbi:MAG: response regulator transcription factor [Phycisphaerales bacterium]|nr:response regulator transcription factor [Phycisphaerales bacterium]